MSIAKRQKVAFHKNIVLRDDDQKKQLLDQQNGVRSELIAFMENLLDSGVIMEITCLRKGHHDDSSGPPYNGTHYYGYAVDWWPNYKAVRGAYLEIWDVRFARALRIAARAPFYYQTGLTKDAKTDKNIEAAGPQLFIEDTASHVHCGVRAFKKGDKIT